MNREEQNEEELDEAARRELRIKRHLSFFNTPEQNEELEVLRQAQADWLAARQAQALQGFKSYRNKLLAGYKTAGNFKHTLKRSHIHRNKLLAGHKKAAGDLNKTNGNLNRINGNVNKNNGNLNRPICLKNFCILNNGQQSELTFQFNQILTNKMEQPLGRFQNGQGWGLQWGNQANSSLTLNMLVLHLQLAISNLNSRFHATLCHINMDSVFNSHQFVKIQFNLDSRHLSGLTLDSNVTSLVL